MQTVRSTTISCIFAVFTITSALGADSILPNPKLTPGIVATTDKVIICQAGYSKLVRHTSGQLKHQVYAEYGIDRNAGHYEIDHLIPLGIGGADIRENLWPESHDTKPWNAGVKDRLENYLHVEVCAGHIGVQDAQKRYRGGLGCGLSEVFWRTVISQSGQGESLLREIVIWCGAYRGSESADSVSRPNKKKAAQ